MNSVFAGFASLFGVAAFFVCVIGYAMNFVKLCHFFLYGSEFTVLETTRVIGVVILPVGAIMGWF